MIQHRTKEVCNVDNTKSSDLKLSLEKPFATSIEFLGQSAFTIAHVVVNMNFHKRQ